MPINRMAHGRHKSVVFTGLYYQVTHVPTLNLLLGLLLFAVRAYLLHILLLYLLLLYLMLTMKTYVMLMIKQCLSTMFSIAVVGKLLSYFKI